MKNIGLVAIGIAFAVGIGGCASGPTEEQKAAATAAKPLTGPEITQLISGNSMTGISKTGKSQWTEYYDPSGQVSGMWKSKKGSDSGKYTAAWNVDGDKLCYDGEGTEYDDCYHLAVNGDQVYSLDDNGLAKHPERPSTLISGKAQGI